MKKSIVLVSLIFLVLSCSEDKDNIVDEVITDDNSPRIQLNIEGFTNTNYSKIEVLTSQSNVSINLDGSFEDKYMDNGIEKLPVFFGRGDEVLFGYFPSDIEGNMIKNKDLILFFLKSYPELAIRGLDDSLFTKTINSNPLLEKLESEMINSLDSLSSPFSNPAFLEPFLEIVNSVILESEKSSKIGKITDEFRFDYNRNGTIRWTKQAPLFSALGISVINKNNNDDVLINQVLDNLGLNLSPSSIIKYLYDLRSSNSSNKIDSLRLNTDGEYEIKFTNGKNKSSLDNSVRTTNSNIFAAHCVGLISPFNLKTLRGVSQDCSNAVNESLEEASAFILEELSKNDGLTKGELIAFLETLSINLINSIVSCVPDIKYSKYISLAIKFAIKRLAFVLDTSELLLFVRDFLVSEISDIETRHFSNGQLVGELEMIVNSETNLTLSTNTDFQFNGQVMEDIVSYDVDRNLIRSKFIRKAEEKPAEGLIFDIAVISGDVTLNNGQQPLVSNTNGELVYNFKTGVQDSKIEIKPSFTTPDILPIDINVNIEEYKDIEISSSSISFCPTIINNNNSETIYALNPNNFDVKIDLKIEGDGGFTTNSNEITIPANAQSGIEVIFSPREQNAFNGDLKIEEKNSRQNLIVKLEGNSFDLYTREWKFGAPITASCTEETAYNDRSVRWYFEEGGNVKVVSGGGLKEGDVGFNSLGGSWDYNNCILTFNLEYIITSEQICTEADGSMFDFTISTTFKSSFTSESENISRGSYQYSKTYELGGNHASCTRIGTFDDQICSGTVGI